MYGVSVILPVYNAELYLEEAVQSILDQTFSEFELIVINDGSTDRSLEILESFVQKDSRVRLVSRENRGLISTLNEAISLANYDFIARMDADDIALPNRFEKQVAYLKKHPDVAVVGTGYRYMDPDGQVNGKRHTFVKPSDIEASLFFCNPIAHPSVMVNYSLLGDEFFYDEQFKTVEDFELWHRLSGKYRIANLPDVLLHYRVLGNSVSGKNLRHQIMTAAGVLANAKPLSHADNGLKIASSLYSFSVNDSTFSEFLKACVLLNIYNLKHLRVSRLSLLKRSLIALVLSWRKNIRN